MKKKITIILTSIISVFVIVILVMSISNKTFFKSYYEVEDKKIPLPLLSYYVEKDNTFYTFRNTNNIRNIINKYVENLQSCYDEGYFYDKDLDITINRYSVEDDFLLNKIYLEYQDGNYCENEFVLDEDWFVDFRFKSDIKESIITKCNGDCDINTSVEKNINKDDVISLIYQIATDSTIRIENKNNIDIQKSDNYYFIDVYYTLFNKNYMLKIFVYNNNLAFKITDDDDHSKNAIYNTVDNENKLLEDVYNKY